MLVSVISTLDSLYQVETTTLTFSVALQKPLNLQFCVCFLHAVAFGGMASHYLSSLLRVFPYTLMRAWILTDSADKTAMVNLLSRLKRLIHKYLQSVLSFGLSAFFFRTHAKFIASASCCTCNHLLVSAELHRLAMQCLVI